VSVIFKMSQKEKLDYWEIKFCNH